MTIPANLTLEGAPYGAQPVVQVVGPQGGPYAVAGPTQKVLLPSGSRTVSTAAPVQTNNGYSRVIINFNVTVNPGGGETLALNVFQQDALGVLTPVILSVPPSAAPGGSFALGPGLSGAAVGGISVTVNLPLPASWTLSVVHSGAGAWTYSVTVDLLP